MERGKAVALVLVSMVACGCETIPKSDLAPLQAKSLHTRDVGRHLVATYEEVWWGTVCSLQNSGFLLRQADKDAGFIYGVWSDTYETRTAEVPLFNIGIPASYKEVEVSVTLERRGEHSTVVRISSRLGSAGEPQDDAQFPQRFFAAVEREVLLRATAKRLGEPHMPKPVEPKPAQM